MRWANCGTRLRARGIGKAPSRGGGRDRVRGRMWAHGRFTSNNDSLAARWKAGNSWQTVRAERDALILVKCDVHFDLSLTDTGEVVSGLLVTVCSLDDGVSLTDVA